MTVASTTRKAGPYTGNGVATSFAFAFKVFTTADISVVKADSAGTESTLVLDSDYSVTLNADQTANPGGSITYPISGSPLTAAERLAILGGVAYNQTTSLPNGGAYNASIVERALDRLTILIQQILEIANRGVRLAATAASNVSGTLPAPVPLALLGWNSAATAIQNFAGVAGVAVSTFMTTVVAAVDAVTARAALGSTTVGDAVFIATSAAAARSTLGAAASGANTDITSVGAVTGVTAAAGDSSTKLATTAFVAGAQVPRFQSITSSVAANALTVGLNPTVLDFRNASVTSGVPVTRTVSAALSLVVPSTATLGTTSAIAARLVLLAIDNAGTVELAIVNLTGGVNLDETTLISTTAMSAAATSASVIYSTTARTNVAFRVVGFIDITETVAGTWAADATLKQGAGGNALTGMSGLGYGQAYSLPTRSLGTTYYNTTSKPRACNLTLASSGSVGSVYGCTAVINTFSFQLAAAVAGYSNCSGFFVVAPGGSYSVSGSTLSISQWSELG